MVTRRDFVKMGAATLALAATGENLYSKVVSPLSNSIQQTAIYDQRFPASIAFAQAMQNRGASLKAIEGDVTNLYFHDLHSLWSDANEVIAGMTLPNSLFCLEQISWQYGRRVVFRAEHREQAPGIFEHRLASPQGWIQFPDHGPWPDSIAEMILQFSEAAPTGLKTHSITTAPILNEKALFISWVIAPIRKG